MICLTCREHDCWAASNRAMADFIHRKKINPDLTYWKEREPIIIEAVPGSLYEADVA